MESPSVAILAQAAVARTRKCHPVTHCDLQGRSVTLRDHGLGVGQRGRWLHGRPRCACTHRGGRDFRDFAAMAAEPAGSIFATSLRAHDAQRPRNGVIANVRPMIDSEGIVEAWHFLVPCPLARMPRDGA